MTKPFLDILYHLSHETGLQLYPDDHGACKLKLSNQMNVQLELDLRSPSLFLVCNIASLPPGTFRENVLKHALYANHFEDSTSGILCYIEKLGALALCKTIPIQDLHSDHLLDQISLMGEKAEKWKKAIDQSQPAPFVMNQGSSSLPSPNKMMN